MVRLDVPTLKCDRCQHVTQDPSEMGRYVKLSRDQVMGGRDEYDLCWRCWKDFSEIFMANHNCPENE